MHLGEEIDDGFDGKISLDVLFLRTQSCLQYGVYGGGVITSSKLLIVNKIFVNVYLV